MSSTPCNALPSHHPGPQALDPSDPAPAAVALQLTAHLLRTALLWVAIWVLVQTGFDRASWHHLSAQTLWLTSTLMLFAGYASFIAKCWLDTLPHKVTATSIALCLEVTCIAYFLQ